MNKSKHMSNKTVREQFAHTHVRVQVYTRSDQSDQLLLCLYCIILGNLGVVEVQMYKIAHAAKRSFQSTETSHDQRLLLLIILYIPICVC